MKKITVSQRPHRREREKEVPVGGGVGEKGDTDRQKGKREWTERQKTKVTRAQER